MNTLPDSLWSATPSRVPAHSAGSPPRRPVCTRRACAPQLIREAAESAPDAVALSFGGVHLTYGQLDAQSHELGGYLRSLGVGPEDVVALNLERPADYVVAALAVWKAGGAYLPLDPSWSAQQRAHILEDAGASILITRSGDCLNARIVVDLDMGRVHGTALSSPAETRREQLAAIIYTAAQGGELRGVEITHGNLLSLIFWHRRAFDVTASDVASFLSGPAYDTAAWELWPYLTAGARVVAPDDDPVSSPDFLRSWLVSERVSMAYAPSEMARKLLAGSTLAGAASAAPWPQDTALRYLLTGNDAIRVPSGLPFSVVRHWGPAECTVVTSSAAADAPGLGQPIAHTRILLLDDRGKPGERPGDQGEICISGPGVARGYRLRPELTQNYFVVEPDAPGRVFHTGEWGRMLPGGSVELTARPEPALDRRELDGRGAEISGPPPFLWVQPAGEPASPQQAGPAWEALVEQMHSRAPVPGAPVPVALVPIAIDPLDAATLSADPKLDEMAAALVRSIRLVQPHGPYYLGGWRDQAMLAYEAAVQIDESGDDVALLVQVEPSEPAQTLGVAGRIRLALAGRRTPAFFEDRLRKAVRQYDPRPSDFRTLVVAGNAGKVAAEKGASGQTQGSISKTPRGRILAPVTISSRDYAQRFPS